MKKTVSRILSLYKMETKTVIELREIAKQRLPSTPFFYIFKVYFIFVFDLLK